MLILSFLAMVQTATAAIDVAPGNLSETLYSASTDATGSRLCDRKRSAHYTAQFDRRYGKRIAKLTQYHVARFGPDPDFIITTSCRIARQSGRRQDRAHRLAMNAFEPTLRELEHRFGPADNVR